MRNDNFIKPCKRNSNDLLVAVDPRIELLNILQYLAESDMVQKNSFEYSTKVSEWFEKHKSHPAVTTLQEWETKGFTYDLPMRFFLQFEGVPFTSQAFRIPDFDMDMHVKRMKSIGNDAEINKFINYLRKFTEDSRFVEFYDQNRSFYEAILDEAEKILKDIPIVKTMKDWFGYSLNKFTYLICPLLNMDGYGPAMQNPDGSLDAYCVSAFIMSTDKEITRLANSMMLFHEFSHSYVNPLVEKYYPQLKQALNLYKPFRNNRDFSVYEGWFTILCEHFVRAAESRLTPLSLYGEIANVMNMDSNGGFIYLDFITDLLAQYEMQRDQTGITYSQYFPVFVEKLLSLAENPDAYIREQNKFRGPFNAARSREEVIIIPDPSEHEEVEECIMPDVNFLLSLGNKKLITDRQAMRLKLNRCTIYVYGTIEGNSWLKKHQHILPFQVFPDKIIADKEYIGSDLRIISCLPNPGNRKYGVCIYTAQTIQAMKNSNTVFHGPEDFVISDSNCQILGHGNFNKKGELWSFQIQ
ncbi:MAG TPA: DUF4932 domain-containing protein [Candidatus Cloacimonadota bacterium]|nr:DUF4932 domain-containing protein [Candidatus Cloacimonadota bacterium]HPT70732.1 DUF4932 domain-containing protein [Candidatus Cloacimonadota bacterium]